MLSCKTSLLFGPEGGRLVDVDAVPCPSEWVKNLSSPRDARLSRAMASAACPVMPEVMAVRRGASARRRRPRTPAAKSASSLFPKEEGARDVRAVPAEAAAEVEQHGRAALQLVLPGTVERCVELRPKAAIVSKERSLRARKAHFVFEKGGDLVFGHPLLQLAEERGVSLLGNFGGRAGHRRALPHS